MEKRRFGKTDLNVSVLGFGGAPIGILETEQQIIARLLNSLIEKGVNLIDTAAAYAGSEEAIGRAVAHRRDDIVLVSKCGDPGNPDPDAWNTSALSASIDRSLKRLQTDHLDVILLHSCGIDVLKRGEALQALVHAREAGKVRYVGYSGDNEAAAHAVTLPVIAVVETSINICDQANIDLVLPSARQHNIGVIAKRPIANAAWKSLGQQPGFYHDYAKTYHERFSKMDITPDGLGFPANNADSWPEIALRFTLSQPGVHSAIIGTTNLEHALANLDAAAKGPLAPEAQQMITDAFHAAEAHSKDSWSAQT